MVVYLLAIFGGRICSESGQNAMRRIPAEYSLAGAARDLVPEVLDVRERHHVRLVRGEEEPRGRSEGGQRPQQSVHAAEARGRPRLGKAFEVETFAERVPKYPQST